MRDSDINKVMPLLERQVRQLDTPWLDELSKSGRDPFKILISCILSLRTKDQTTMAASKRLFALAGGPADMAALSEEDIREAIYPAGFYRVKARTIREINRQLIGRFGSKVPPRMEDLLSLKGVGRKTANLVLTLGFDSPGICVDTHVHRITNRWGYVSTRTPHETEFALRGKLPKRYWKRINGLLVAFGQRICKPVSPICSACSLTPYCARVGVRRHR
ncbi:MAG: endonuclease III [Nitrospiraceae bacterium]|nr:endonuclease III [Nitrospiraceae bacterium]